MLDKYQQTQSLLLELEHVLKESQLWSATPPSAEAMNSTQPFSVDTLDFEQWLQFVLIPKMQTLLDAKQA